MVNNINIKLGTRIYVFKKKGKVRRLPIVMLNSLANGKIYMPEYADENLPMAIITLALNGRRPISIQSIFGLICYFDKDGSPAVSIQEQMYSILSFLEGKYEIRDQVIDITSCLRKKRFLEKVSWKPSEVDIEKLADRIWRPERGEERPEKAISPNIYN